MPLKIKFYATNERIDVAIDEIELVDFGGQGQIYKWVYRGNHYLLKIVPRDDNVFIRLKAIKEAIEDYARKSRIQLPIGITKRAFPVGGGYVDKPEELGFDPKERLMIIVYNWIDGERLDNYLRDIRKEPPLSPLRVKLAKRFLDILIILEKAGVVNYDTFPDNFIVGNDEELYIIDMEGAGVIDTSTNKWTWLPVALGKDFPGYCAPPELQELQKLKQEIQKLKELIKQARHSEEKSRYEKISGYIEAKEGMYIPRWLGVQILFEILTGYVPFAFMRRIDVEALYKLYRFSDKRRIAWPPYGSEKLDSNLLNNNLNVQQFRDFIRSNCGSYKDVRPLEKLAFLTFIYGFENPSCRPNFEFVKVILGEVLAN